MHIDGSGEILFSIGDDLTNAVLRYMRMDSRRFLVQDYLIPSTEQNIYG